MKVMSEVIVNKLTEIKYKELRIIAYENKLKKNYQVMNLYIMQFQNICFFYQKINNQQKYVCQIMQ